MPSGRRPPPPPPPKESSSAPPPLPSRNHGNSRLETDADDTYEQPACHPNSNNSMTPKLADLSPAVDSYDSEDWSDSEWNDTTDLDVPVTIQSDDTYITPDGGMVADDEYNMPDETQTTPQKAIKPRSALPTPPVLEKPNVSREDKNNNIGIKLLPATNRPLPPPKKPMVQQKPVVMPKPSNPSDSSLPKLPPRPGERPSKPLESKNNLDDNASSGSVSSESNIRPQDTKVHPEPSGLHVNKNIRVKVFPVTHEDIKKKAAFLSQQVKAEKFDISSIKKVTDGQKAQEAPIYDDGVSEVLSKFDWFHGELDRGEASKRVKKLYENGAFLIRASNSDGTNNSHPYTLVVTLDNKVYNLKIRLRHDQRFAIGTYKSDEVSFTTVPELVEHHRENNIKLAEGGTVKLQRTPKK